MALLPTSVTTPLKVVSGRASRRTTAGWPGFTMTTSVSSTRTSASISDRSAMVRSTVPGLLIVPMMALSPSSTLSAVMTPDISATMRICPSSCRALRSDARICSAVWPADRARASAISSVDFALLRSVSDMNPLSKSCCACSKS